MKSTKNALTDNTSPCEYVLDGFVLGVGPDGQRFIVPEFILPATHEAFDGL